MQWRYTHLEHVAVKTGESVEGGSVIGTMGTTGKATGPHLYLEIMQNEIFIDPSLFIDL